MIQDVHHALHLPTGWFLGCLAAVCLNFLEHMSYSLDSLKVLYRGFYMAAIIGLIMGDSRGLDSRSLNIGQCS